MKLKMTVLAIILGLAVSPPVYSDTVQPISDRPIVIGFSGKLVDESDLTYDGTVEIAASYYKSDSPVPSDLIYSETFNNVEVNRGTFRVPLLGGSLITGNPITADDFVENSNIYVSIKVNGQMFLENQLLKSSFAAVRSDVAEYADTLRKPIVLMPEHIPTHDAGLITTGVLNQSTIPSFSASNVSGGTFSPGQIPAISANLITSGSFSQNVLPSQISADKFNSGVLSDDVIPDDILTGVRIAVTSGHAAHGEAVGVPAGYHRDDCHWVVGLRRIDAHHGVDQFTVAADDNGVITCEWDWDGGDKNHFVYCEANYLTICRK